MGISDEEVPSCSFRKGLVKKIVTDIFFTRVTHTFYSGLFYTFLHFTFLYMCFTWAPNPLHILWFMIYFSWFYFTSSICLSISARVRGHASGAFTDVVPEGILQWLCARQWWLAHRLREVTSSRWSSWRVDYGLLTSCPQNRRSEDGISLSESLNKYIVKSLNICDI